MKMAVGSLMALVILSTIVNWAALSARRGAEESAGDARQSDPRLVGLERTSKVLQGQLQSMEKQLSELEASIARPNSEELLASDLAEVGVASLSSPSPEDGGPPEGPTVSEPEAAIVTEEERKEQILEEALATLFHRNPSWEEQTEVFRTLAREGLMDVALAEYERRAEENPDDPDFHAELGNAYLQKLFHVDDMEKGVLSMKADKAYDRALKLNDHHWDARFAKAMIYSFSPPILGLGPKAVEQFEILVAQQEAQVPESKFAQTYLLLGNLYANEGKAEKAREVWTRGLERHPEAKDLTEHLDNLE